MFFKKNLRFIQKCVTHYVVWQYVYDETTPLTGFWLDNWSITRNFLLCIDGLPIKINQLILCINYRIVYDIGDRDMSLSKNVERHHCLRHVEISSDIFKNVDKNVDVENVEIFKRATFIWLHRDCLHLTNYLFLNIMLIVKRYIFYDTCAIFYIWQVF